MNITLPSETLQKKLKEFFLKGKNNYPDEMAFNEIKEYLERFRGLEQK